MLNAVIGKPKCVVGVAGDNVVHEHLRLNGAVHIANVMIRDMKRGDMDAAYGDFRRMESVVLQSRHPEVFLGSLARRLGRTRALAVGIERDVIDRAVR